MSFQILIVDDEKEMCLSLAEILSANGFQALYTVDPLEVLSTLNTHKIDLIIMDMKMPKLKGIDLLKNVKAADPLIPIIMITGYPSIENAVNSMKYGALNFYIKPLKIKELLNEIQQLAKSRPEIERSNEIFPIITQNPTMHRIMAEITKVARTDAPVLITGESGTGKELAAGAIHFQSRRKDRSWIKVNCASIPDTLLESELFGHEKGAFTDAIKTRAGKFELADSGTIFLDEIGDMSLQTQPKILRVLQDGEIQRLGGMESIRTDVRLITATNKKIEQLLDPNRFRADLYYRISVVTIHLPPLRERKDDLVLLTDYFLNYFNQIYKKNVRQLSEEVKALFIRHQWPGNIRELKNCLERAVIFAEAGEEELGRQHLPAQYREIVEGYYPGDLDDTYDALTKKKITEALAKSDGVKYKAAEFLRIHRKTLYNKMRKLGLE
ncbi:MAG: sigma-54-dependent Fis family transcriptional regulator [Desulfobacteraceae bacterium]|nr:MAG: sigma-54-dependent Fis family transcriptional regulator [Desulfobacteraceae bacterium]